MLMFLFFKENLVHCQLDHVFPAIVSMLFMYGYMKTKSVKYSTEGNTDNLLKAFWLNLLTAN